MTIGIPSIFSYQSSNITDHAPTLDILMENCEPPVFDKGLEVREGEWVYEYRGNVNFIPKIWSANEEAKGTYNMDEIIIKDCVMVKVTGKKGPKIVMHERPKEPEDYKKHDTSLDPNEWQHRYLKVSARQKSNWLERTWTHGNRQYVIQWNEQISKYQWVARDNRGIDKSSSVANNIEVTAKYTSGVDEMASVIKWGLHGQPKEDTVRVRSMVERKDYFYLRTDINAKLEYNTWTGSSSYKYAYGEVKSPIDIDGFVKKRRTNAHCVLDGKNYTQTLFDTTFTDGKATWVLLATSPFDSIAFGHVITDTIDFVVTDQDAKILFEINNYAVDNTVVPDREEEYRATVVLYTDETMPAGSIITITLKNPIVSIGEIMPASKLDAGFTKMTFKNKFKDFSPKEQDQWGSWFYRDGLRVTLHSGVVDFPLVSYDRLNRLMLLIGGQRVIINSSDSIKNELPDGINIFEATMLIARFVSFELSTKEDKKRMGDIASYSFSIEELV